MAEDPAPQTESGIRRRAMELTGLDVRSRRSFFMASLGNLGGVILSSCFRFPNYKIGIHVFIQSTNIGSVKTIWQALC